MDQGDANGQFVPEQFFSALQGAIDRSGVVNGQLVAPWHNHQTPRVRIVLDPPGDDNRPAPIDNLALFDVHEFLRAEFNRLLRDLQFDFGQTEVTVVQGAISELRFTLKVRPHEHWLLRPLFLPWRK